MNRPSNRMIRQLAERCVEIGLPPLEDAGIPDVDLGKICCGRAMLIVMVGPDLCPCCGKPQMRACLTRKTALPLEKLFSL